MNIIEKLKQFNVEVTPEMEKAFSGDFLSELEVNKKLSKAENDRDSWKQRAETAEETLKGFEGKDFVVNIFTFTASRAPESATPVPDQA